MYDKREIIDLAIRLLYCAGWLFFEKIYKFTIFFLVLCKRLNYNIVEKYTKEMI